MASDPDRETLCALFDGELQGDAARFAHRRLGHDAEWRAAFGRWQLAGDVMRRQSEGLAPFDFAGRVADALEVDAGALPMVVGAREAPARTWSRRRWIPGAALAASVAVAALFVVRPLDQPDTPAERSTTPRIADRVAAPSTPAGREAMPLPSTAPDPVPAGSGLAAAAVAVADAPRRAAQRRQMARQDNGGTAPLPGQEASMPVASTSMPVDSLALAAGTSAGESTANPFGPESLAAGAPETQPRPWPRAVLPGYGARDGYSVGYDTGAATSPSFYPFEPRLQETPADLSAPGTGTAPEPGSREPY